MSGIGDLVWMFLPVIILRFILPAIFRLLSRARQGNNLTVEDRISLLYPQAIQSRKLNPRISLFIIIVSSLLVLHQLHLVAIQRPMNIYRELSIPISQSTGVVHGHVSDKILSLAKTGSPEEGGDADMAYYEGLLTLFKTDFGRKLYDAHGPEILRCAFCKENLDYVVFSLSKLFLTICSSVLVLGIATSTKTTAHLRAYSIAAMIGWGLFEALVIVTHWNYFPEGLGILGSFTLADKMAFTRILVLIVLLVLPHLLEKPNGLSDQELLVEITSETARIVKHLSAAKSPTPASPAPATPTPAAIAPAVLAAPAASSSASSTPTIVGKKKKN